MSSSRVDKAHHQHDFPKNLDLECQEDPPREQAGRHGQPHAIGAANSRGEPLQLARASGNGNKMGITDFADYFSAAAGGCSHIPGSLTSSSNSTRTTRTCTKHENISRAAAGEQNFCFGLFPPLTKKY